MLDDKFATLTTTPHAHDWSAKEVRYWADQEFPLEASKFSGITGADLATMSLTKLRVILQFVLNILK
jgi:hypothetical protein